MLSSNSVTSYKRLLFGADEFVAEYVAANIDVPAIDHAPDFGPLACAVGIVHGGNLVGGWVYHTPCDAYGAVQLSVFAATPMWARRDTIVDLLDIAFAKYNRVYAFIGHTNERALKCAKHIGFITEGIGKDGFGPGRHAVAVRMVRREFEGLRRKWAV